jgi:hypothetical protein
MRVCPSPQFILSFPVDKSSAGEHSSDEGGDWQASKDRVGTANRFSSPGDIAAARSEAKTADDPLSLGSMDESLVVHRFAEDSAASGAAQPFSVVLNKFNTVKDHVRTLPCIFSNSDAS